MDLEKRKTYLGGTDAAPCLGLSRWKSPLQLWAEKSGTILLPEIDNEAIILGRELEDYVARRFSRLTGKKVRKNNKTLFHPKFPFLGANLDREIIGEDAILECKTCSAWKANDWEGEEIPLDYIIQVTHYLMVTGAKKGYIACLIGNQNFVWKEIIRDEKLINDLLKKEKYFWETFIIPKVMPTQITKDDNDILYQLFPKSNEGEAIKLGDEAERIVETLQANEADLMALKDIISKNKNELKALMKENAFAETAKHRISWKEQITKRLDTDKLKEEQQEIYQRYLTESKFKVLRINAKKEAING